MLTLVCERFAVPSPRLPEVTTAAFCDRCMSFGSQVGHGSRPVLDRILQSHLVATVPSHSTEPRQKEVLCRQLFSKPLPSPTSKVDRYVCVEGYWVPQGPLDTREVNDRSLTDANYVLTESVRANLKDLARVVSAAGSLPVLLQGETSVGKTSLITYLASRVGQVCYRINNHEHTNLQTYLGVYIAASASHIANNTTLAPSFIFQEGIFV
ncbi:unnamed protein product [Mesocestoides corti]|uniref:ATPase dynein-related AAA domain-containing protein n=2 Tax=Mesocestoides corti TaxID=53468 RepID=A0A0R3UQ33_MESCO|nr:unnamed protein product [Mesocestoides corti]